MCIVGDSDLQKYKNRKHNVDYNSTSQRRSLQVIIDTHLLAEVNKHGGTENVKDQ